MLNVCILLVKVRQLRLGQFDSPWFNSSQFNSSPSPERELGEMSQIKEESEGRRRELGAKTGEPAPRLFLRWDLPFKIIMGRKYQIQIFRIF